MTVASLIVRYLHKKLNKLIQVHVSVCESLRLDTKTPLSG